MIGRFDRGGIRFRPLAERTNKLEIVRDAIDPDTFEPVLSREAERAAAQTAEEIRRARSDGRPVILAFGAHAIKNGLAPVLISLMERSWVTHFATNGAGIIHDWEFAFQGESGEDVESYAARGQFGIWQETGFYLNVSFLVGAYSGRGYGESVGALVDGDGLLIPSEVELQEAIGAGASGNASAAAIERAASAADLLQAMKRFTIEPGFMRVDHPYKQYGFQGASYRRGVPLTGHPMIGHDIIYTHPASSGAAIGRTAERDFLAFVDSVSRLEGGVYLSIGSAIMSPMIFEKALSMARNVTHQRGGRIRDFSLVVVDLAAPTWDWGRDGEPPEDNPAYYLRFLKTFSRMGGRMTYVGADNRSFLASLHRHLTA